MSRWPFRLEGLIVSLLIVALAAGCGGSAPAPSVEPSPSSSHIAESVLPTPSDGTSAEPTAAFSTSVLPTPAFSTSILPTPATPPIGEGLLLLVTAEASSTQATLEMSEPNGSKRQALTSAAADPRSAAVSPDNRYVAFFATDGTRDGTLNVWDQQTGETVLHTPVPAEVSGSFRDASPVRYLAWSPDSQNLAVVMNRDLHLVDISEPDPRALVRHREDQYAMAGLVMGSIKQPSWAAGGRGIVYDAWVPPDILSESADDIRGVEHVDVSTGTTELLAEDAKIVRQTPCGEQGLILQRSDGSYVALDLTNLEIGETTLSPETQGPTACDPEGRRRATIVSEHAERDRLRFEMLPQGTRVDDVHLADIGEFAVDCQFQSVLWSPAGDTLLATLGCPREVSLWSIRVSDLEATHLIDWPDTHSVVLLASFQ